MKVDRARFLLLTTALSAATAVAATAGGCTVKSADSGTNTTPPVEAGTNYTDGATDSAYYDASDAAACLDDTGLAPTCEGADLSCATICEHYLPTYKKGVARAIADCLVKLPTCEGAANAVLNCVQTALGAACTDPTADTFCAPLVDACDGDGGADSGAANPLEKQECIDLATGLNANGRTTFTTCVQEGMTAGYCGSDPTACIDSIE